MAFYHGSIPNQSAKTRTNGQIGQGSPEHVPKWLGGTSLLHFVSAGQQRSCRSPRREIASTTIEGWGHKQMTRSNRCRATWPPDPTGGDYFRCRLLALRRRQLEARVRCFNVCLKREAVITPRKRELPRPARSWDVCPAHGPIQRLRDMIALQTKGIVD